MQRPPFLRTFSYHYKEKIGFPVGKIPLHIGEVCPNREKGGCIYCAALSFAPGYLDDADDISTQIQKGKEQLLEGRFEKYFAYFQQETVTASSVEVLLPIFQNVLEDNDCVGLIISTRPDYLEQPLLVELADMVGLCRKACLFEIGLQSVHDPSLELLNRNHSYADFLHAYQQLRSFSVFEVGVHLILGIPGESEGDMITTVKSVCDLGIDALKLHHLQVIQNTPLDKMYQCGEVKLFNLEDYLHLLVKLIPLIPQKVVLHRLCATAHPQMLIAPKWNILATEFSRRFLKKLADMELYQGMYC